MPGHLHVLQIIQGIPRGMSSFGCPENDGDILTVHTYGLAASFQGIQ